MMLHILTYKVGMMGNYNEVKTKGNDSQAYYEYSVYLPISNSIKINGNNQITFTRYLTNKTTTFAAFTNQLKQGYEYTLLYGLGYCPSDDYTKSTEKENEFSYLETTLYSSEITTISNTVTFDVDSTKEEAYLALKCDVVHANVICRHLQKWWWGNQPLNTYDTTVYVFCNAIEMVVYL